ncbi:MAG: hypothetical protein LUI07_01455, partial [Lachnospiraceae bacterium]|nr:hypothetical protein [Lachnospiraceae bacterium]
ITHSTRILEALHVDATHVLVDGRMAAEGDASLIDQINERGFEQFERITDGKSRGTPDVVSGTSDWRNRTNEG